MQEDLQFLELLKQDGDAAIEYLFRNYYSYLCKVVYRILHNPVVVEDIVQEVFYELWRKREQLVIEISVSAYLRRATVNKTLNHIRAQKMQFDDNDRPEEADRQQTNALQQLQLEELEQLLHAAIEQLPERCRLVFSLSRFEQMTYKEIATHLGISIKTVEHQISKALRLLQASVAPYLIKLLVILTTSVIF